MDHTIGRTQYSNARNMHSLVFIDPTITTTTSTSWKDSRREILHSSTYLTDTGFKEEVYHAYTFFNERNTWHDWFLVPTERPVVEAPAPKTNLIDIPGTDGAIDATTVLTGYPLYSRRTGSWTFKVMNGYYAWDVLYSRISSFLHGRTLRVMLEDDAMWFYEGRFEVSMSPGEDNSEITISYDLDPYKYKMWTTQEDWLWDNMDFEYGFIEDKDDYTYAIEEADTIPLADIGGYTIESHVDNPLIHNSGTSYSTELVKVYDPLYSYKDKKYYGEADIRDLIGKKPVCPKVIISGADATNGVDLTLESNDIPGFTSKTYNFKNGETTNHNFRLTRVTPDSTVNLVVNGSCTLKLDFRRGEL